ncbi:hypothetical protein [Chlorogloeopsis fritschii]|nr:hypothetical protein [Chlorogloeopsis fritschii]
MPKPLPRRDISRLYTSNSYRDSATPKFNLLEPQFFVGAGLADILSV